MCLGGSGNLTGHRIVDRGSSNICRFVSKKKKMESGVDNSTRSRKRVASNVAGNNLDSHRYD